MDKLTRYNQKLLAIIGTIVLCCFVILIISLGGILISDLIGSKNYRSETSSSENSTNENIVSYQEPIQIDTNTGSHLIPVGAINPDLELPSSYYDSDSPLSETNQYSRVRVYNGTFNNFIYYDDQLKSVFQIFKKKTTITAFTIINYDSSTLLLFQVTEMDTNKDGAINNQDFQHLYVYYTNDHYLKEYTFPGKTLLNSTIMEKTNLIGLQLGVDQNKDNVYEMYSEPKELIILNITTRNTETFIPDAINKEIKRLAE